MDVKITTFFILLERGIAHIEHKMWYFDANLKPIWHVMGGR